MKLAQSITSRSLKSPEPIDRFPLPFRRVALAAP
jgi:hypothetical protein